MAHKPPPPALAPYLRLLPETSLILLTSTLGCSVNWLVARFIGGALKQFHQEDSKFSAGSDAKRTSVGGGGERESGGDGGGEGDEDREEEEMGVVLVSWIRDEKFWREEVRRVAGIDLSKANYAKRFAFVDCFDTENGTIPPTSTPTPRTPATMKTTSATSSSSPADLPSLLQEIYTRITTAISNLSPPSSSSSFSSSSLPTPQNQKKTKAPKRKIHLILDTPTLLLPLPQISITPQDLSTFLLHLRSHPQIHTTYLSLPADLPFLSATTSTSSSSSSSSSQQQISTSTSPLEIDTTTFLTTQAHLSHKILSVRELATGAARDISGVLRITRGGENSSLAGADDDGEGTGRGDDDKDKEGGDEEGVKEAEFLYLVQRDGGVKVFQRGGVRE
ncbi:hypothetical protein BST61_g2839 [Cercospora zeina]